MTDSTRGSHAAQNAAVHPTDDVAVRGAAR